MNIKLNRPMMQYISRKMRGKALIGVEIGVDSGVHAQQILEILDIDKLYLVDPYEPYSEEYVAGELKTPQNSPYHNQDGRNGALDNAMNRLKQYDNKQFIRMKSEDAIDVIPNELDFVYIDGNHDYEYIKRDIELWYPKVRKNGIIGGHDYDYPTVHRAVNEYFTNDKIKTTHRLTDWWVVKND